MKKLAIAVLALAVSTVSFAQQKAPDHKRFEAEKAAFITEQLELTPEEAQLFWPVYNKVQGEQRDAFREVRARKRALRDAVKAGKPDAEISRLLEDWLSAEGSMKNPMYEHRAEFRKILGESKTAKLYLSEEAFRNRAIRNLAGGGKNAGKWPGSDGPHIQRPPEKD